jgi:putative ABC transport system substrate-binding protein
LATTVKLLLAICLFFISATAQAQTPIPRLAVLVQEMGRAQSQAFKGVSAELLQLGYREHKNIIFEIRDARGDRGALQTAAKELAAKKVAAIFTAGTRATLAASAATREVPVVFVHPGDPQAAGMMKDSGNSAGNITGVAAYAAETTEKRLALFKQILPALMKIYVFYDANSNSSRDRFALVEAAAKKLALQVSAQAVKSTDELKTTLGNLQGESGVAIFQITDDLVESEAEFIFATARQKKLPTMFNEESWAIGGATAAYGPSYFAMGRLAGRSIDQILRGKVPGALPITRATKFDLTINYRAANYIGLQLPKELLKQANKVIR